MDTASQPLISVIMPVYNSAKYLQEAVVSILGQTLADFELILIDDGSTDDSSATLEYFRKNDARVIVQRHSKNQGVAAALNTGLASARGRYIARMDADDISLPERFEKQVDFLDNHVEIDIVGSTVILVDEHGKKISVLPVPLDSLAIRWAGLLSAAFMHPTIMLRHSFLVEHGIKYSVTRDPLEDFAFFSQLLEFAHGSNFSEPLLLYRIHPASVTSQYSRDNLDRKSFLIYSNIQNLFPSLEISQDQVRQVSNALLGKPDMFWKRAQAAENYLRVWQAFAGGCTPTHDFYRLQTGVALIAAKLTLYPPFQPGWRKTLRHIFRIEPRWPVAFARKFPEMVSTKIHTQLIRRNRK